MDTPTIVKEDSCKISMTLPPPVFAALEEEGRPYNMTAGEFAKSFFTMCFMHADGAHLNLRPVLKQGDPNQLTLSLEGLKV